MFAPSSARLRCLKRYTRLSFNTENLNISARVVIDYAIGSSNNGDGPEFLSELFQTWLKRVGIEPIHIYPDSPWDRAGKANDPVNYLPEDGL